MADSRVRLKWFAMAAITITTAAMWATAQQPKARFPQSLRLYVFDCGILHFTNADNYQLKLQEVARLDMSVPCFLVAHPKGTMMWDVGAVADGGWKPAGSPVRMKIVLPDSQERDVTMVKPLNTQLAEAGYSPADITHLAFSHYHWDHIANANDFAGSTWLVRKPERDVMFSDPSLARTVPANFKALAKSKTVIIQQDDYDVFGDGKVILKSSPGHTPGHQVLFLNLPKTGPVVLGGDLYHYPEERKLNRLPTREFNVEQTAAARLALESFLKKTGAQLWIQHDISANAMLKKSPAFYE